MIADYTANPAGYRDGSASFSIDAKIYGSSAVKARLKRSHSGKCAYCEIYLPKQIAHGHVDHFRPKAYSKQTKGSPAVRPGYYWLAYDWDNLFLSCFFCNSTQKGNQFPLANERSRARHHGMSIAAEQPHLIKPDAEDPANHITWYQEVPVGITDRGRATIAALGLDEPAHETRLAHYNNMVSAAQRVRDLHNSRDPLAVAHAREAAALLAKWRTPQEQFSAMVDAYLRKNPLPVF